MSNMQKKEPYEMENVKHYKASKPAGDNQAQNKPGNMTPGKLEMPQNAFERESHAKYNEIYNKD